MNARTKKLIRKYLQIAEDNFSKYESGMSSLSGLRVGSWSLQVVYTELKLFKQNFDNAVEVLADLQGIPNKQREQYKKDTTFRCFMKYSEAKQKKGKEKENEKRRTKFN